MSEWREKNSIDCQIKMNEDPVRAGKRTIVLHMANTQLYYCFISSSVVIAFSDTDAENLYW